MLLAAVRFDEFATMSDELKRGFLRYLEENQPFIIDRNKHHHRLRDSIYWPEKDVQVFLGKMFHREPNLKRFQEMTSWKGLYMDEEMLKELNYYESQLDPIKPWHRWKWLRWELKEACQPHRRQGKPGWSIIRNAVDRLIYNSGEITTKRTQVARDRIKAAFEERYGKGSFDA